jgi:putative ABC transport system permease protein
MPPVVVPFYPQFVIVVFLLSFAFTGTATLLATRKALLEHPAQGMRPAAPNNSKRIFIERIVPLWKGLSATGKFASRSIVRNKRRILLSSIGVIGSEALLFSALSMHSSVSDMISTSIDSMLFDMTLFLDEPVEDKNALQLPFEIESLELTDIKLASLQLGDGISVRAQILENGSEMLHLFDRNQKRIPVENNSFIVPITIADQYNLRIGDSVAIKIHEDEYTFRITGINVQAFSKKVFIGEQAALDVGISMEKEMMYVQLADHSNFDSAVEAAKLNPAVAGIDTSQAQADTMAEVLGTLNAIIMLIANSSAVMAVAVIYNISSVNILDRAKDYATILALGHTMKQVSKIIASENLIMTVLSAIVGPPLGFFLFRYLFESVSQDDLTLSKRFSPFALIVSIAIIFVLTAITNLLLRGKIQKISLVDTLKSQE